MSTKTITLAGSEERAEFSGANAWLRNDGADVIYAAAKPGITAGADGVVAIPAGQSAPVYGANGAVWLLGTGPVQLIGSDYSTNPFKTSAQAGGSGADEVARAAINAHSGNAEIHVTAEEKAEWNGKAEVSDIPDELPVKLIGDFRSGSILDAVLSLDKAGYVYFGGANCSDMPVDGAYFYGEVRKYSTLYEIIATNIGTGAVYTNRCNNSHVWYGWKNVGDGGNAASVGAYTEAKLAALEARVAALEGK